MTDSPFRSRPPIDDETAVTVLVDGELDIVGRMPWSSNGTFLVDVAHDCGRVQAVYKPLRGERPLWDFPTGLYRREVASYRLSAALGWDVVPPTVEIEGPLGEGSLQLFVPCDYDQQYFTIVEDERHHRALQRLCVFDHVVNSTDRKGGHVLLDEHDHVWAIDNGLTFHAEFKLRTVVWHWAGEEIPDDIVDDVVSCILDGGIPEAVAELLDPFERDALAARARWVCTERRFPVDPTGRRYPWPLV